MSYDKSVWTEEEPREDGAWYWCREKHVDPCGGQVEIDRLWLEYWDEFHELRSVHAIPSAEEIAALVECERQLRSVVPPGEDWWCPTCCAALSGSRVTFEERCDTCGTALTEVNAKSWGEAARAALARLDAVRKEQGK